jgi:hypothetical protein
VDKATEGFIELLKQGHDEGRERVLDGLVSRLDHLGFDVTAFPRRAS